MAIEYNFKYMPLVGKLSGESMVRQTETAINEIAQIVNENTAQAEIINTLAEQANSNSVEALEKANEALETSGRIYLTETLAVNLNNYCESQLIYINNAFSQNLPVAHKGFLEVKTNDTKTQATQVFADDVDKKFYVRTGAITASTVGDVTTYTADYSEWTNIPNSADLANYLPVAGGTMSGDIEYSASEFAIKSNDISNDGEVSIVGATDNLNGASLNLYGRNHTKSGAFELNANNGTLTKTLKGNTSGSLSWDGNELATRSYVDNKTYDYLPLSGGTLTGNLSITPSGNYPLIYTNSDAKRLSVVSGSNIENTGPSISLYGQSYSYEGSSASAGQFLVKARKGSTYKDLVGKPDGTLTWDGVAISLNGHTHSYLPLSGGTLTGAVNTANNTWNNLGDDAAFGDHNVGGKMCVKTQTSTATGIAFFNSSDTNVGQVEVNNSFNFNKTIMQNGISLAPQKADMQATSSDINVSSGSIKNLMSFTLVKGTWFVQATAGFTGNSNGYRRLGISTNTTSTNADRYKVIDAPSPGSTTAHLSLATIIPVTSTTTFYINVYQNSGSTLATGGGYILFRLSADA